MALIGRVINLILGVAVAFRRPREIGRLGISIRRYQAKAELEET